MIESKTSFSDMDHNALFSLRLVHAPLSNQEGTWLFKSDLSDCVSSSKLYMIAQREDVKMIDFENIGEKTEGLRFSFKQSNRKIGPCEIKFSELDLPEPYNVSVGDKIIKFFECDEQGRNLDPIEWLTVDKILFKHWRGDICVEGLEDLRALTTYRLHYVGISSLSSFYRLFGTGHRNRTEIISNEHPICPTARVTDEIFTFLFDIEQLHSRIATNTDEDLLQTGLLPMSDRLRVVKEAEKAFTSILKPLYNTIKFKKYPRGRDGLYGSDLDRYAFVIAEDIAFTTDAVTMMGCSNPMQGGDMIGIEGDRVSFRPADPCARYPPPGEKS